MYRQKVKMQADFELTFPNFRDYCNQLRTAELMLEYELKQNPNDSEAKARWNRLQSELASLSAKVDEFYSRWQLEER